MYQRLVEFSNKTVNVKKKSIHIKFYYLCKMAQEHIYSDVAYTASETSKIPDNYEETACVFDYRYEASQDFYTYFEQCWIMYLHCYFQS